MWNWIKRLFRKTDEISPIKLWKIETLELTPNPKYQDKLWGYRPLKLIDKIIVHQELSEGDTLSVHNYHISNNCHIKAGGCPKIAYHYTIEKDGTTYKVNDLTDVTWHCFGKNLNSIGIMLCGDFSGPTHVGKSKPTKEQLDSLEKLINYIRVRLNLNLPAYGHCDFGKENCPGNDVMKYMKKIDENRGRK